MAEFYGIDLGTTYSCISVINEETEQPEVISNPKGDMTTPSVVYIDDKGKVVVGKSAKSKLGSDPDNTVAFIKREMSTEGYTRKLQGKEYNPSEISSMILKHLVEFANKKRRDEDGKDPISDVVITVPAYFGRVERERTAEAGKLAGLNVLQLINEPTAAALSYGHKQNDDKTLMVYDLGGGTFDVTIMKFHGGIADTLSSRGNHKLGGADWDRAIVDIALEKEGLNWDKLNKAEQGMLMIQAEDTKQALTDDDDCNITFNVKGIHSPNISRTEFESRTSSLMMQTQMLVEEALDAAHLKPSDIDEVILVGGSSRMPMVNDMVHQIVPDAEIKLVDPDRAVAKGAALTALQNEKGSIGGLMLGNDKGSRAYGIRTLSENNTPIVVNVIMLNDDLIIENRQVEFFTASNGQDTVELHFYESTCEDEVMEVDDDLEIRAKGGNNTVTWGKPVPKGTLVAVTVNRDKSGIVTIKVRCSGAEGTFEMESANAKKTVRR